MNVENDYGTQISQKHKREKSWESQFSYSLIIKESHRDHKRTQQGVPNVLLPYLYYRYMVCTSDKYPYSNVHVS